MNIVMLDRVHPHLLFLFTPVMIGLSLSLLCGIPLTLSPWIKNLN